MRKALLVDDVKLIISMERSMLNRQNLQLFTANSGPEALAIHRKEQVDLVLLDQSMPGMNGDEVCRIIRNDDSLKSVSIIMVIASSSSKKEDIEKCMNAGANDCITKPINTTELLEKIANHLGIPRRQNIRVIARLKVKTQSGDKDFFANTVDISTGGVLIESDDSIGYESDGDAIKIDIFLPGNVHPINTIGKVVRRVDNGRDKLPHYGVQFIDIAEKDRKIIEKHIERHYVKSNI